MYANENPYDDYIAKNQNDEKGKKPIELEKDDGKSLKDNRLDPSIQ